MVFTEGGKPENPEKNQERNNHKLKSHMTPSDKRMLSLVCHHCFPIMPDPGKTMPDPGKIMPDPGKIMPDPGKIMPDPGKIMPDPGKIMPDPGKIMPDPGKIM